MRSLLAIAAVLVLAPNPGSGAPPKPTIVWKPIPFSAARKAEMAAYSLRHYGLSSWRLRSPHVIVEHYAANDSLSLIHI